MIKCPPIFNSNPHNPHNLSDDIVGVKDGWRLLDKEEIHMNRRGSKKIEYWDDFNRKWTVGIGAGGSMPSWTYRTKLSRKEISQLPRKGI